MKCKRCGNEAALSKVCPYCGASIDHNSSQTRTSRTKDSKRSTEPGQTVVSDGEKPNSPFEWIRTFFAYISDATVSVYYKIAMLVMFVYIVSPIDLIVDFLPIVGWLDDAAVVALLWRFVSNELTRYYRLRR